MGIYKEMVVNGTETKHWLVDQSLAMPMTLNVDYKGTPIVSYDPKIVDPQIDSMKGQSTDKWWVTGWNPNYQCKLSSDLKATYTVNFTGKEGLYNAFYHAWNGFEDNAGNEWSFNDSNHTATLIFKEGQR